MSISRLQSFNELIEYVEPTSSRSINEVVLHHSWSPTSAQYKGASTWQGIRSYHINSRGWSDIGYHFGVAPDNTLWALRHYGRSGAHVLNRNAHSIGVCVIGNYDVEDPSGIMDTTAQLFRIICDRFKLSPSAIRFHREFQNKTCPGARFKINDFRKAVYDSAPLSYEVDVPVITLAVVLGGNYIECEPKMVGGRLTVDADKFSLGILGRKVSTDTSFPKGVIHDNGRMFIYEASRWFDTQGWVIDGRVWSHETLPGGITVQRLYPKRLEWM